MGGRKPRAVPENESSERRSKAFLQGLLEQKGWRPKRSLGQNFITDPNLLDFLARTAVIGPEDSVLEVGTGTGQLSPILAKAAAKYVGVEIDPVLHEITASALSGLGNATLLLEDALSGKNSLNPAVVEAIRAALPGPGGKLALVSNLAYNIAAPLVAMLFETGLPFASMTVTVQLEMAERMCASGPQDPGYGPLSLQIGWFGEGKIVRRVTREVFWPRPKVSSAVARIEYSPACPGPGEDYDRFKTLVRAAFGHRRKTAAGALAVSGLLDRRGAMELVERAGLDGKARAEEISPEGFRKLAALFRG